MFNKIKATLLIALLAGSSSAALAHQPTHHRAARHAHGAAYARAPSVSAFEPARMIEIRPGLFVGSYQCHDERGRSCDSSP
jgi:hypothetical protein